MFPGYRSTEFNRFFEYLVKGFFHPLHFFRIAFICQTGWMQVAITGMAECPDFQIIFLSGFFYETQHFRHPAAGNGGIFENCSGFAAGQRR